MEKLTREEAISKCRKQWAWHAENPMKKKEDYPEFSREHWPIKLCYLCEYTDFNCKKCPMEWPKTHEVKSPFGNPPCVESYFGDWDNATAPEERSKYAALIRDLPEKKVEPAFKIGDWVKVLNNNRYFEKLPTLLKSKSLPQIPYKHPVKGNISDRQDSRYGYMYAYTICYMHNNYIDGEMSSPDGLENTSPPAPKSKFSVGDKVVPMTKSSYGPLDQCPNWRKAQQRNQPYLFVNRIMANNIIACHVDDNQGYKWATHYLVSDLIPYTESPKSKFKVGDIVTGNAESCKKYTCTNAHMTKGEVIKILQDNEIIIKVLEHKISFSVGETWAVEEKYFDLVKEGPKQEMAFKVGDRVKVTKNLRSYSKELTGKIGTIKYLDPSDALIKFDENIGGHGGMAHNLCEYGYGWYVMFENLELITEPPINLCPEKKTVTELSISYKFDGAVTTCVIQTEDGIFIGKAKCSPDDKWDEKTGRAFALLRANQKHTKAKIKQLKNK